MTVNQHIKRAISLLRAGGLVAFPTETVYGLGADASNPAAVAKIFAAKGRPANNPLIVHLAHFSQLTDWVEAIPSSVEELAKRFWPGPLTLVLKKKHHVSELITGGQQTVAIRIPRHPLALELLNQYGSGLVAPSANKYTHLSPTDAASVYQELGDKVDLILDGGPCEVGLESTILDMTAPNPALLRPGMIPTAEIEAILQTQLSSQSSERAPGMCALHYAPITKTIMLPRDQIAYSENVAVLTLDQFANDPIRYAQQLYRTLRELDNKNFTRIIIEEVPNSPEWAPIRDRLVKACARE